MHFINVEVHFHQIYRWQTVCLIHDTKDSYVMEINTTFVPLYFWSHPLNFPQSHEGCGRCIDLDLNSPVHVTMSRITSYSAHSTSTDTTCLKKERNTSKEKHPRCFGVCGKSGCDFKWERMEVMMFHVVMLATKMTWLMLESIALHGTEC